MNQPETPPIWRPLPDKLRAYEAVYWLNRCFQATLLSLERLEQLGMFRLEYLNEYKVRIERTRADANEELIETLQERETEDSARFDRMERDWEDQRADPDDVFFHARDRKQQIKEQMKELQKGLERSVQGPSGCDARSGVPDPLKRRTQITQPRVAGLFL